MLVELFHAVNSRIQSPIAPPIGLGRKENASCRGTFLRQLKLMNIPIFPLENMMRTDAPRRKRSRSRSSSENDSNKSSSSKQETYETGKEVKGQRGKEGKETDEEPVDLERGTKRLVMKRLSRRNSKAVLLKNAEEAANVTSYLPADPWRSSDSKRHREVQVCWEILQSALRARVRCLLSRTC